MIVRHEGKENNRVIGLDFLRISLAMLIYMFHSQMHFNCSYYFLNDFVRVGAIAMTGFMILSGFVLYISYSKKDFTKISEVKIFYFKRLISIFPLYYSIAFIFFVCQVIRGQTSLLDEAILFPVELFTVQSTYFSLFRYSHNGGTWFISCILICYAVYPYIQFLTTKLSNNSRLIAFVILCGLLLYAPLVRIYFHLDMVTIYANPFYRLLEFMIGVILAQIVCAGTKPRFFSFFINCISLIVAVFFMLFSISVIRHFFHSNDYMLYNWIALPCFIVIILNLALLPYKSIQHHKYVAYLSSIAFTFFLCQVLPLWSASRFVCNILGRDNNFLKIGISFSLCLLGAVLIHEVIEKPASRYLKNKLLK